MGIVNCLAFAAQRRFFTVTVVGPFINGVSCFDDSASFPCRIETQSPHMPILTDVQANPVLSPK